MAMLCVYRALTIVVAAVLSTSACGSSSPQPAQSPVLLGNAAFDEISRSYLEDSFARYPTWSTYLYTMGKLMILKLRDDYKTKLGDRFTLQDFHDTFISLGPLPMPLIRKAMLGEVGRLF